MPAPPLGDHLLVQLQASNGRCWEAHYLAEGIRANESGKYKAKATSPAGAFVD